MRPMQNSLVSISLLLALMPALLAVTPRVQAQDDQVSGFEEAINALAIRSPICFGMRDITEPRALDICDALALKQNVKARELSEQWVRLQPESPAAQFALAEVLFSVEGNMARALFHLNRAEELTGYSDVTQALESGNFQWHFLTLSQLSNVHQLMGNQLESLRYLDKIYQVYDQDIESFRGWSLIKLKDYEAARMSANRVLETSDNERERARAWNTLCAADLVSLTPPEDMNSCDKTMEDLGDGERRSYDTVYLTNASEVSLSLLEIDQAEAYLNRATQYLNEDSPADPWIYKLYLTMNQSRFDEALDALNKMLIWRDNQSPIIGVMNRAEHFMVSASFLLLAGYPEDAIRLTEAALNQPDRNGSYSADDFQKDAMAALINSMANRAQYEIDRESMAGMGFIESIPLRMSSNRRLFEAWRSGKRAASLFAEFNLLQNRLRPYAPLDVHIPEWIEPELVALMGSGVMSTVLEKARENGAFSLNEGYYWAYRTEIAALERDYSAAIQFAARADSDLPDQESLLRARVRLHSAIAAWETGQTALALEGFEIAYLKDPSIVRRLGVTLPVRIERDDSQFASQLQDILQDSPRFEVAEEGFLLELRAQPDLSICLKGKTGNPLSCYTLPPEDSLDSEWNARELVQGFHTETFGLGYEISKAQRSVLLGTSVILSSQSSSILQQNRDAIIDR